MAVLEANRPQRATEDWRATEISMSQFDLSHPTEDLNQPPGTSEATGITKVSTGRKNKVR